jgi:kumamolisin
MQRIYLAGFLTVLALAASPLPAASPTPTALSGSVQPVDAAPSPTEPHRAFVSRSTLRSTEQSQTLNFEVVLQMKNFAELQQRVAQGARIAPAEMAARYQPSAADYQKVVDWLVQQGFTIRRQDPSHVAVFASGQVNRLAGRFSMKFARVTQDGTEYTSAITAPAVPADIGALLVGINGLQPHLRPHRHMINSTSGAGAPFEPSQLAQAYNATPLYNYDITGQGQTIAIVIDTFPNTSDLSAFWTDFGVNRGSATVSFIDVVQPPAGDSLPAPSGEETLDTEISSSIAPGANVRVYATYDLDFSDIDEAYAQIYSDVTGSPSLNIHEMSMSFGAGEYYVSNSQLATDDQYFAEIAAAGVTIFASAGDEGATPSSSGSGGGRTLTPETPSSDPNVIGVGGTALTVDGSGNESSEVVWNDIYGATGGGISRYFSRPSWQTGTGVNTSARRQVPDIAADADPSTGAYVILNGTTYEYGGTSLSSPAWAGFCALLNQARANVSTSALGLLGPSLYPLLGTANFRDITSGNDKFESSSGYSAGPAFDLCTGCGAPNVTVLAQTLSGSTTLAPTLLSVASVQSHAGTPYSIPLPLTGNEGIECRQIKGALSLVFTFAGPVASGDADVAEGTGSVENVSCSGDTMTVSLTGVTDAQNLTVTVSNINTTSASDSVTFGVLLGDVNGDGLVSVLDSVTIRNDFNQAAGSSGFNPRADLNEDGLVSVLDSVTVRNSFNDQLP